MASEDVFEIKDYVAATEWERFIKHFEEFLYDLEPLKRHSLPTVMDGKFLHSDFYEKTSEIAFCDVNIVIIYTRLKESLIKTVNGRCCVGEDIDSDEPSIHEVMRDIASENNEFLYSNHCLSRWYGLKEFIIIHPADDTGVLNCRHRIVQSSAAIALVNTDCDIPVFVQLKEKERRLYSGVCVIPGAIINFEMVHLKDIHPQYMRLNGLYSIFKEKMCCDYISLPPVSVSVRLSYIFHWRNCIWPLKSYVGLCLSLREDKIIGLENLRFRSIIDPIKELHLFCTWPCLPADMAASNKTEPEYLFSNNSNWTARVEFDQSDGYLGISLESYLKLFSFTKTACEVMGNYSIDYIVSADHDDTGLGGLNVAFNDVVDYMASPDISRTTPMSMKQSSLIQGIYSASSHPRLRFCYSPIPANILDQILGVTQKHLKAAPVGSLIYRLAVSILDVSSNVAVPTVFTVACLWLEFVHKLRYCWENSILLPDLDPCFMDTSASFAPGIAKPDTNACLLHQKLQMLNCCIEHRIKRQTLFCDRDDSGSDVASAGGRTQQLRRRSACSRAVGRSGEHLCDNSSEESFVDCEEVGRHVDCTDGHGACSVSGRSVPSVLSPVCPNGALRAKPEGASDPLRNMFSLVTNRQLFIPITQDRLPMTDDMIEEQEEALIGLASTREHIMAKSVGLHSDMGSFKAANPGCCMEDFVRWYSPDDDFVEDDVERHETGGHSHNDVTCGDISATTSRFSSLVKLSPDSIDDERGLSDEDGKVVVPSREDDVLRCCAKSDVEIRRSQISRSTLPDSTQDDCLSSSLPRTPPSQPISPIESPTSSPITPLSPSACSRNGALSYRLWVRGSIWPELWSTASPIPARRQKRLFDETVEAEKVLSFLSDLPIGRLVVELMPLLLLVCVEKMAEEEAVGDCPYLRTLIDRVLAAVEKDSEALRAQHVAGYERIARVVKWAERSFSQACSLREKFCRWPPRSKLNRDAPVSSTCKWGPDSRVARIGEEGLWTFVVGLLDGNIAVIQHGKRDCVGSRICQLIDSHILATTPLPKDSMYFKHHAQYIGRSHQLPPAEPSKTEYVFRTMTPRPAACSKVLPQRMYCSLSSSEFRLAGAFCSDTILR